MQTVTAHGATIPAIGFGTWNIGGDICARAVEEALKVGYRHIDTAAGYRNEDVVGGAIKASGVPREEIFLTTKVAPEDLADDDFQRSADRSVKLLGVGQVDLLLIHWPSKTIPVAHTIRSLNKARERGLTRHIGVSNFTTAHLKEAWAATEAPLVTNQCEYHPYLNQDKVLAACRENGMFFTAFSPLAREAVLADPVIHEIAVKHERNSGSGHSAVGYPAGSRGADPEERKTGPHRQQLRHLRFFAERRRDGGDHPSLEDPQAAGRQSGCGRSRVGRMTNSCPELRGRP